MGGRGWKGCINVMWPKYYEDQLLLNLVVAWNRKKPHVLDSRVEKESESMHMEEQ